MESAMSIINKGLYAFGDIDSFSVPFIDLEQIFSYHHGNAVNKVSDYIFIFRMSKDNYELESISEQEQKEMLGKMEMRRSALLAYPTAKVNGTNILGIIDKKNMKVVYNDNFMHSINDKLNDKIM